VDPDGAAVDLLWSRRVKQRGCQVIAAVVAAGALARPSGAQEATPHVRLSWARGEGAESCVDSRELAERVRARLGRDPFDERAELSIEGVVTRTSDAFRAELRVRDGARTQIGQRELSSPAADCSPLGDAVVLAVALTLDPHAAAYATETASGAPSSQPQPLGLWTENPVVTCPPAPSCPEAAPCPACEEPRGDHVEISARGVVAGGVLPGPSPGAALFAAFGSAAVRGTVGMTYLPEQALLGEPFSFGLTTGALGACWVPVRDGRVQGAVCGEAQLGAIHAVVRELTPLEPGDHLWVALGAGPRLSIGLLPPLRFELGATLLVPLARKEFAILGEPTPVFESSPVGVLGFLGLGAAAP